MRRLRGNLSAVLDPGDSVLVLCPAFTAANSLGCVDLLAPDLASQKNVLSVQYTQSPGDWCSFRNEYGAEKPAATVFLNVNADSRLSSSEISAESPSNYPDDLTVKHLSPPTDLTGLGVEIANQLDQWTTEVPNRQIVACFHSITALLQYVNLQQTIKFLEAITSHFAESNTIGHFHIDPMAHQKETISQVTTLFDAVCEYADDTWTCKEVD